MHKTFGGVMLMIGLVLSSLAHAQPIRTPGWQVYTDYAHSRGLHVKPLVVRIGHHSISINSKQLDTEAAVRLLRKSQTLSPRPDILVRIERGNLVLAEHLMRRVSHADLCSNRKCLYQIVSNH